MPRFFVPTANINESTISILGDDARHIARSLRMAVGDIITVCDMKGNEHTCTLTKIRDEECICEINSTQRGLTEPPIKITLYMAYPKGDKLEVVVQKAVELGAYKIVPFFSERCIKRPAIDKTEKNTKRLNRIAEEAAKQCGRSVLPEVMPPISFDEVIKTAKEHELAIFCYEGDGTRSLKEILSENIGAKSVAVIIGSEGGFSLDEARYALDSGLNMASLGKRILRCETAPAFALSALTYFYEL